MQIRISQRLYQHRCVAVGMALLTLLPATPAQAQSTAQTQPTWLESTTTAGTVQGSKTYYYRFYTRSGALNLQGQFPSGYQANATVAVGRTMCHFSFNQGKAQAAESCNLPENALALLRLQLNAGSGKGGKFNLQLNQVATAPAVVEDTPKVVGSTAPVTTAVTPDGYQYQTLEYTRGPQPTNFLDKKSYAGVDGYYRDYRAKPGQLSADFSQVPPGIKARWIVNVYDDPTDGKQDFEFRQECVFEIHNPKFDPQGVAVFTTTDRNLARTRLSQMDDKITEFTQSPCIISDVKNRLRSNFVASYKSGSRQETIRLFIHNVVPLEWPNVQYQIQPSPFYGACGIPIGC